MKHPRWLKTRKHRRVVGTIEVHLDLDTTRFDAEMERAAEAVRVLRYRHRIENERSIGLAHVGVKLDGLCRSFGMDPGETWRLPRHREAQDRRDRVALSLRQWASLQVMAGYSGIGPGVTS